MGLDITGVLVLSSIKLQNNDKPPDFRLVIVCFVHQTDRLCEDCKSACLEPLVSKYILHFQYYQHCFCGNKYNKYGSSEEKFCNTPCLGNKKQICGGSWTLSVYKTGLVASPFI